MADAAALSFAFMRAHPADAARVLEAGPSAAAAELFARVPARIGSTVLAEMLPRAAAQVLLALPGERGIELLTQLGPQPCVAILRYVEESERARLIAGLPTAAALTAKLLVQYLDDSVGSCVDPGILALAPGTRVREALERVRAVDLRIDRVFVVDESRCLLGWIPLDALMRAPAEARLEALLLVPPPRLAAQTTLAGARSHPGWQAASLLPVVDRSDRLIGVLTREALERAVHRVQGAGRARGGDESMAEILANGYWQSVSGILRGLTAYLPEARALRRSDHEG